MAEPTLHQRLLDRIAEDSDGCEDTSAAAIVDALRAIVELHRQGPDPVAARLGFQVADICGACGLATFPCPTIRAVAEQLEVTVDG